MRRQIPARRPRARAGLIEGSRVVGRGGSRSDEDARPSPATRAAAGAAICGAAGKRLTQPAPSAPRAAQENRKGGDGKGGARFAAQNLADNYLNLCHHPLKDLRRWLAEDKKKAGRASGERAHSFSRKEGIMLKSKTVSLCGNAKRVTPPAIAGNARRAGRARETRGAS